MNLFNEIRADILGVIHSLYPDISADDTQRVTLEPPRDPSHGDMATNAAMVLAKRVGQPPRTVAEALAKGLEGRGHITQVDIAGPGFLNLRLAPAAYLAVIPAALKAGPAGFGASAIGQGIKVNVEYVSANPTGPVHFGHTRNAVFGDALARLLEKGGYDVTREYYVNDAGAQVDKLARSVYWRYCEACGETTEMPEGLYPGDYLVPLATALVEIYGRSWLGAPENIWLPIIKAKAIDEMMTLIKTDLQLIDVQHNIFTSEKHLTDIGAVDRAVQTLTDKGLVYTGVLPPPKSKKANLDEWEPIELLLFKSSAFGDDEDRALKKSDGTWTYATPDIAYQYDKFLRGYQKIIVVVAVDHAGWVKRLTAGTKAVTDNKADVSVQLYALVNLMKNGEPVKLSKRAGNILSLREVVDEVGAGAIRFIMLTRRANEPLDFDLAKAVEQSKDNPYFYIQYAHARCCSVLKHGADMFPASALTDTALAETDVTQLNQPDDVNMARLLAAWPRLVEQAVESQEPHRIAYYAQELAAAFHAFWNRGRDNAALRFLLADNKPLTLARLSLVRAIAVTLASALGVMGVAPLQELRSDIDMEAKES